MPEQTQRSMLSRIAWFLKIFVPMLVGLYILVFFVVNDELVEVQFLFTKTLSTIRPVIVVSMVAGALIMLLIQWLYRLATRRR